MNKREEFQKILEAQLNEWNIEINKMKEKADKLGGEFKTEFSKHLETLREKQKEATAKLEELRGPGGEAWEDLKSGAEATWENLSKAVKSAASRFK